MAIKWFEDEADRLTRDLDKLTGKQLREIQSLLTAARNELIQQLATTRGVFTVDYLNSVLASVERDIRMITNRLGSIITGTLEDSAETATEATDRIAQRFNIPTIAGATRAIDLIQLQVLADFQLDLITKGITEPVKTDIKNTLRTGYLTGKSGFDIMKQIESKEIDPLSFKSKFHRAEAITRTEVGRIAGIVQRNRAQDYSSDSDEPWRHKWRSSQDDRVRPSHVDADLAGPLPIDKPFDIGGYQAFYPHDPGLPAEESVNCRCVVLSIPPGAELT
jgi:hypothetical protein